MSNPRAADNAAAGGRSKLVLIDLDIQLAVSIVSSSLVQLSDGNTFSSLLHQNNSLHISWTGQE
jgi:hypothetical protein